MSHLPLVFVNGNDAVAVVSENRKHSAHRRNGLGFSESPAQIVDLNAQRFIFAGEDDLVAVDGAVDRPRDKDGTESSPFLVETLHGSRLSDLLLRYG